MAVVREQEDGLMWAVGELRRANQAAKDSADELETLRSSYALYVERASESAKAAEAENAALRRQLVALEASEAEGHRARLAAVSLLNQISGELLRAGVQCGDSTTHIDIVRAAIKQLDAERSQRAAAVTQGLAHKGEADRLRKELAAAKAAAEQSAREGRASYIYLASPYSHPDHAVMEQRFQAVCRVSARLMSEGKLIFSPIAHTHPIAVAGELPRGWDFWERYDVVMVGNAEKLMVLQLPGWDTSKGVAAEIEIAKRLGIPVEYMEPADTAANAAQP